MADDEWFWFQVCVEVFPFGWSFKKYYAHGLLFHGYPVLRGASCLIARDEFVLCRVVLSVSIIWFGLDVTDWKMLDKGFFGAWTYVGNDGLWACLIPCTILVSFCN